jgi:hypothetical protein
MSETKNGTRTSEYKLTVCVIALVIILLVLSLTGVVSIETLKNEVPAALLVVGGLVTGAYSLSRGLAKMTQQAPPDGGGDGGAR